MNSTPILTPQRHALATCCSECSLGHFRQTNAERNRSVIWPVGPSLLHIPEKTDFQIWSLPNSLKSPLLTNRIECAVNLLSPSSSRLWLSLATRLITKQISLTSFPHRWLFLDPRNSTCLHFCSQLSDIEEVFDGGGWGEGHQQHGQAIKRK